MHQCHTYQKKSTHREGSRTFIHSLIFHHFGDFLALLSSAAILLGSIFVAPRSSALSYQSTIKPQFTINDTLTVTVSSADIYINDLAPGQSDISNIIDITVRTNNAYGYTLTSTAGNGDTYKDTNLTNTLDGTKTFTSLATTDSIASPTSFDDSEWGYSFSTDAQATWSNYSGLPYYGNTGATLLAKDTQSAATGDVVNFKIAAKSSSVQTAGTYNNVINFMATGNPIPVTLFNISTMQEMTSSVCSATTTPASSATTFDTTGEHAGDTTFVPRTTLTDTRDGSTYLVSKLADGHCWMSQNLALELTASENVTAYNFSTGQTFNYSPAYTTQTTTGTAWEDNAGNGARSYGGDKDKYVGGTNIAEAGTISNTGGPYEKIGILYNWAAATAQTGEEAAAAGTSGEQVIPTSICPKGWRLPANSGDYSFSTLMGSYELPTTNQKQGYSDQLDNPLNFNRPGYYNWSNGILWGRGVDGDFWSSVGYSAKGAHDLSFYSAQFYPQDGDSKGYGFSVRCVAV
ncbi:hypothetical protein IKE72_00280 [Candidatus Saccharibacteria bacterium]|nr:hypothetical protein [Candidatus Saccharibacteria bacterium]